MGEEKTVCVLSFSGRKGGNCAAIGEEIRKYWSERAEVRVFDFSGLSIAPCGCCEYQCFHAREACPHSNDPERELCEAVAESGLTYFIVPNYCDYPCANFFAFNERSQCCFQGRPDLLEKYLAAPKKFIVVSNTNRDNFTAAFRYHMPESEEPEILFLSAKAFQKRSIDGGLMESAQAREALLSFLETD